MKINNLITKIISINNYIRLKVT